MTAPIQGPGPSPSSNPFVAGVSRSLIFLSQVIIRIASAFFPPRFLSIQTKKLEQKRVSKRQKGKEEEKMPSPRD